MLKLSIATIAAAAVLAAPAAAFASNALAVAPLEPSERITCSVGTSVPFVTWKRGDGTNRNRSVFDAGLFVDKRAGSIEQLLEELAAEPPTPPTQARIAKLQKKLGRLALVKQNLARCGSGEIFDDAGAPSFRLLCRFGFHAPAVASRSECSIDLSRETSDANAETGDASWNVSAVAGIADELLAEACARTDGTLLRNTNLSADAPMYSAFCAHEGKPVATHYAHNTLVLGMEEEPTGDCIAAIFLGANADDPCGDYKRPPNGGGTGTPPPPPASGDCIVTRMEEEPTGCE